jgi:hypothetical protein
MKKELPAVSSDKGLGTDISALFGECGIEHEIPEWRGYAIKSIFDSDDL